MLAKTLIGTVEGMTMNYEHKIKLLLSDARGVYIPQNFVECFDISNWGLTSEDVSDLLDKENEWYWEAWESVLNKAKHTDSHGNTWTLHQGGDLWAIRDDMTEDDWEEWGII